MTDRLTMIDGTQDAIDGSLKSAESLDPSLCDLALPAPIEGKVLIGPASGFSMPTLGSNALELPSAYRTASSVLAYLLNNTVFNIKDYGAVGDGASHPLSGYFASLALAQAAYPHATALSDEIDWAGTKLAVTKAEAVVGAQVFVPNGIYLLTYVITTKRSIVGESWGARFRQTGASTSLIKPNTDHGITLFNFAVEGIDTTGGGSASAIFTTYDSAPSGLIVDHILINGAAALQGFASGIVLENTQGAQVKNCRIRRLRGTAASNGIMLQTRKVDGGNLASANALVLPAKGNSFRITGTTQINSIRDAASPETVITLAFAARVTVQHNAKVQLLAGANYVAEAEVQANYPHDFIILQKASAGVWKQVAYQPLACNNNKILGNDIEFETGPTGAAKMGYSGIALRAGGSFNVISGNRIKGSTGAQISVISTTTFVDACRHNEISLNTCLALDGKATSAHANQEAAIELGGRMLDNSVMGDKIYDPVRWGVLLNEDGTYKSHKRTHVTLVSVWRAAREGIMNLGASDCEIVDCTVTDCSQETANAFDGIRYTAQPIAAAFPSNGRIARNRVSGARHRYGINVAANAGIKPFRTVLENNIIPVYGTAPIFDGGDGTVLIADEGAAPGYTAASSTDCVASLPSS